MEIEIDADGRLRIRAAQVGTSELDRLIHQLADVRTTMEPEVPRRQDDAVDAVTFTVQDDPAAYVTRDADGRISIGLRHAEVPACGNSPMRLSEDPDGITKRGSDIGGVIG